MLFHKFCAPSHGLLTHVEAFIPVAQVNIGQKVVGWNRGRADIQGVKITEKEALPLQFHLQIVIVIGETLPAELLLIRETLHFIHP